MGDRLLEQATSFEMPDIAWKYSLWSLWRLCRHFKYKDLIQLRHIKHIKGHYYAHNKMVGCFTKKSLYHEQKECFQGKGRIEIQK